MYPENKIMRNFIKEATEMLEYHIQNKVYYKSPITYDTQIINNVYKTSVIESPDDIFYLGVKYITQLRNIIKSSNILYYLVQPKLSLRYNDSQLAGLIFDFRKRFYDIKLV